MYSLKQAALLAHDKLITDLKPFGYAPDPAPNIWTHRAPKTTFCLCVDDFGIKSFSCLDTDHLITALKQAYNITVDLSGKSYCGLDIDWNYDEGWVDISMPKFVKNTLDKLQHSPPLKSQHSPHDCIIPRFSTQPQIASSDNCLHIDTDAAYLVAPNSKSRVAGYFYLSNKPSSLQSIPTFNAAIHVECRLLRHIVSSAAESKTAGIFTSCQAAIPIRHMLTIRGNYQPPTPIKTDNKTASTFSNNTLKSKRRKSWDIRYHWIKDRSTQNQFVIYCQEGLKILLITLLNIFLPLIIKKFAHYIF